jgi:hypothetical protein
MNVSELFLKTTKEFDENYFRIKKIFNMEVQLPYRVFKDNYSHYLFEEFDWALSEEFWDSIKKIANLVNDSHIILGVIDPHPVEYYFKEFNYYNWAEIPLECSSQQYYDFLWTAPESSQADSIVLNSNTIIWASPSMKWGVWGDRSYGVCVLAFRKDVEIDYNFSAIKSWITVEKAVDLLISANFKDQKVPEKIKNMFLENFKIKQEFKS